MKKFLIAMVSDEKKNISSKRVMGTLCILSLIVALFFSMFSKHNITPSKELIEPIAWFAFASFSLTSIEQIFKPKEPKKNSDEI